MTFPFRAGLTSAVLAIPLLAAPAQEAVATGTLSVSALVVDTCLVVATPLAFGTLSGATVTTEVAPAQVAVTCTSAKPAVPVTVDGGASASGGVRRMSNGGAGRVPHSIVTDAGRSNAVGVGGPIVSGAVAARVPTAISLYGAVPAGGFAAGAHVDAATITVSC